MKTAKIGAIFLVSVMALAAVGAGYALWYQDLTIDVEINTGKFCVGIRDDGTGDPGPSFQQPGGELYPTDPPTDGTPDPDSNDWPWSQYIDTGVNDEEKNVASTISINDPDNQGVKCWKEINNEMVPFYHKIAEEVNNSYPWYCSWINITFANCGTVPAKIKEGKWQVISGTDLRPWIKVDEVWLFVDGTPYQINPDQLEGFQYQLDPCHRLSIKIFFHFEEWFGDRLLPQWATMTFTYFIKWAQWNEVPGDPWTPPVVVGGG